MSVMFRQPNIYSHSLTRPICYTRYNLLLLAGGACWQSSVAWGRGRRNSAELQLQSSVQVSGVSGGKEPRA
jgi:hypothetical protein